MPDARAQQLVTELRSLGLTDSQIGRAVELNSSAIAQIAGVGASGRALAKQRGAGYGASAAPALQLLRDRLGTASGGQAQAASRVLASSGEAAAARRRRTVISRSGELRPARVRQATRQVGRSGQGAILSGAGKGKGVSFDKLLAKAARDDREVSLRVNMEMGDGSTKWITLKAADAHFWQDLRYGWTEDDGDLDDWFELVVEDLAANGELSSDLGSVIGFAVQVAA